MGQFTYNFGGGGTPQPQPQQQFIQPVTSGGVPNPQPQPFIQPVDSSGVPTGGGAYGGGGGGYSPPPAPQQQQQQQQPQGQQQATYYASPMWDNPYFRGLNIPDTLMYVDRGNGVEGLNIPSAQDLRNQAAYTTGINTANRTGTGNALSGGGFSGGVGGAGGGANLSSLLSGFGGAGGGISSQQEAELEQQRNNALQAVAWLERQYESPAAQTLLSQLQAQSAGQNNPFTDEVRQNLFADVVDASAAGQASEAEAIRRGFSRAGIGGSGGQISADISSQRRAGRATREGKRKIDTTAQLENFAAQERARQGLAQFLAAQAQNAQSAVQLGNQLRSRFEVTGDAGMSPIGAGLQAMGLGQALSGLANTGSPTGAASRLPSGGGFGGAFGAQLGNIPEQQGGGYSFSGGGLAQDARDRAAREAGGKISRPDQVSSGWADPRTRMLTQGIDPFSQSPSYNQNPIPGVPNPGAGMNTIDPWSQSSPLNNVLFNLNAPWGSPNVPPMFPSENVDLPMTPRGSTHLADGAPVAYNTLDQYGNPMAVNRAMGYGVDFWQNRGQRPLI